MSLPESDYSFSILHHNLYMPFNFAFLKITPYSSFSGRGKVENVECLPNGPAAIIRLKQTRGVEPINIYITRRALGPIRLRAIRLGSSLTFISPNRE